MILNACASLVNIITGSHDGPRKRFWREAPGLARDGFVLQSDFLYGNLAEGTLEKQLVKIGENLWPWPCVVADCGPSG